MKRLDKVELVLPLAISLSLAVGYVAGRVHENSIFLDSTTTSLAWTSGAAQSEHLGEPRVRLNPAADATPIRRASNSVSFGRYQASGRVAKQTSDESEAHRYSPEKLGEFIDTEMEVLPNSEPKRIGEFIDPDEDWIASPTTVPVSIGEFIDPDELFLK